MIVRDGSERRPELAHATPQRCRTVCLLGPHGEVERDALHLYLSFTDLLGCDHEHCPEDLLSQVPVLARAPPTDVAGAEHLIGHDPGVFDPFAGLPRIQAPRRKGRAGRASAIPDGPGPQ